MGPGFESLKVHQPTVSAPKIDVLLRRFRAKSRDDEAREKPKSERERRGYRRVSVSNAKGPPVPIPNTEVKLCSAENTCLETDRKDRS